MPETSIHIIISNSLVGWLGVVLLMLLALELVTRHLESLLRAIKGLIKAWKEPV
jgi:hypothetical protein